MLNIVKKGRPCVLGLLGGLMTPVWAASFLGIAYPDKDVTLSVHVAGVVSHVQIEVGQRVKAGQALLQQQASMETLEVKRRKLLRDDQSALILSQKRLVIIKAMVDDARKLQAQGGVITQDELRKLELELVTAESDLAVAEAEIKRRDNEYLQAEADLKLRTLNAPHAGQITDLTISTGEWAEPGAALIRLVDTRRCEFRVKVSPAAAHQLKAGQVQVVRIRAPQGDFARKGRVSYVSPVSDAASSLVDVRIALDNADGRIRAGSKGSLQVEE